MARLIGITEMVSQYKSVVWSFGLFVWTIPLAALDLSKAVVVFPETLSGPEKKAVTMLIEEVDKLAETGQSQLLVKRRIPAQENLPIAGPLFFSFSFRDARRSFEL